MGNSSEIKAIEQAIKKTTNKQMYERYLAVRLRLEGQTLDHISKTLHRNRKTVCGYIQNRDGVLGSLGMGHLPGKPPKLTEQQTCQLTEVLTHKRPEAKYTWSLKLAIGYIKREFQQTFSKRGLLCCCIDSNLQYTLATANPEEQINFHKKTAPVLKKAHRRKNISLAF